MNESDGDGKLDKETQERLKNFSLQSDKPDVEDAQPDSGTKDAAAASSIPPSLPPRVQERANELGTFQTKCITWKDPSTGVSRKSTIILQNENGPCSLLALANILILQSTIENPSLLSTLSSSRSNITAKELLDRLGDLLITQKSEALTSANEIFSVLPNLVSGMTIDPRFESFDSFEMSTEISVLRDLGVELVHGWLPHPSEPWYGAVLSAASYESAVAAAISGREENDARGLLIEQFLDASKTQLTKHGMQRLHAALAPGSLSMFFRNDHFSTLYKHPESGQLFTLVTDAGYANSDAVWESLADVNGVSNEFFTGDFSPLGFQSEHAPVDTDYELARQLQQEQDAAHAQNIAREEQNRVSKSRKAQTPGRTIDQHRTKSKMKPKPPVTSAPSSSAVTNTVAGPSHSKEKEKDKDKKDCMIS